VPATYRSSEQFPSVSIPDNSPAELTSDQRHCKDQPFAEGKRETNKLWFTRRKASNF